MRRRCTRPRFLALALSSSALAFGAQAHAPQTRAVAATPEGGALAIALPGFGLVLRRQATEPFAYACSALLGMKPADVVPALVYRADGALLMGSPDGLRTLSADGCPRANGHALSTAPIVALAQAPSARQIVYAVVAGDQAGIWCSEDGGEQWELRAPLPSASSVTALVVSSADPQRVLLSETAQTTLIRASSDGGRSFMVYPQPFELTLLHAQGGARERLWAMARDALTVGNRGRAILRTDDLTAPWQTPVRVAYFGGFVEDARGVISIGDELGGMLRSDDAGDSFRKLSTDVPIACLARAGDALWACTPGALDEPALQHTSEGASFTGVVALPEVTRLVSCAPELDVEHVCAAAWVEWQRDVLRLPLQTADAGAPLVADAGAGDAGADDAGADDAAQIDLVDASPPAVDAGEGDDARTQPVRSADPGDRQASGCTARPGRERSTQRADWAWPWLTLAVATLWRRCAVARVAR